MSVYFAEAGPYIKIGYSADPASRMTTVTHNGARPDDLPKGSRARLIGWIPGDRRRESTLHAEFAAHRVAGEWFTLDVSTVRDLIWADPSGIDLERMTSLAALAALEYPQATRDDIAAAGIRIEGVPLDVAFANWDFMLAAEASLEGGAA